MKCWAGSVGLFCLALSQSAQAQNNATIAAPSAAAPQSAPAAGASQVNEATPAVQAAGAPPQAAQLAPTGEAAMPANYRALPLTLRAEPGELAPFGYVATEEVSTKGLIVGGAILGGSYVIGLAAAVASDFHNQGGWLAIPLVGPWLSLGLRRNPCDSRPTTTTYPYDSCNVSDQHYVPRAMLFLDGVAQLTGTALLAWTLATPTRKFIRRDVAEVHFMPTQFGRGSFGLAAVGRF